MSLASAKELDSTMDEKSKTEKNGSQGHYKPRMAADRTENLWKHQCIHCRGWVPCDSENLQWQSTCSSPSSEANGFASSGGQPSRTLEELNEDCADEDVGAHTGEGNEWRSAVGSNDDESP